MRRSDPSVPWFDMLRVQTASEEIITRMAIASVFGAVALLPPAAASQFSEKKVLTPEIARKTVTTAEAEAARNHLAGVLAVVDDGASPILIEPMDHAAYLASVELARTPPTGSVID